jgi:hypothetical protein
MTGLQDDGDTIGEQLKTKYTTIAIIIIALIISRLIKMR